MTTIDLLARAFLACSHETMVLPIILVGYTALDRRKWGTAIYIMLFTMILSKFLKNIWQIPLPMHLGIKDYAFPSGHMLFTVTFYGWIMLQYGHKILAFICLGIMLGVTFGLMHFGYHGLRDIFGGIGFGILTLAIYNYIISKFFADNPEKIGLLLAPLGLLMIFLMPPITFLWLPFGALSGFAIGWNITNTTPIPATLRTKALMLGVSILGVALLKFAATLLPASALTIFITYALVGFWIAVAPRCLPRTDGRFPRA